MELTTITEARPTTPSDHIPETLSELLLPNDPAAAREMANFHMNALLQCLIRVLPDEVLLPSFDGIAAHLAGIEALLAG